MIRSMIPFAALLIVTISTAASAHWRIEPVISKGESAGSVRVSASGAATMSSWRQSARDWFRRAVESRNNSSNGSRPIAEAIKNFLSNSQSSSDGGSGGAGGGGSLGGGGGGGSTGDDNGSPSGGGGFAGGGGGAATAPELDPTFFGAAMLMLVSGTMMLVDRRGRKLSGI